ncbi:MAG: hypothetical protein U0939_20610 [Pirellulales bacterium]
MANDDRQLTEEVEKLELDEDEIPFTPDSLKVLNSARKGKLHKFVLIRKGARVACLVVFKRGEYTQFIKDAKQVSTGTVFYGTVTGSGNKVEFRLSAADGFEKPPVKKKILRDFLNDEAGVSLVVSFEMTK